MLQQNEMPLSSPKKEEPQQEHEKLEESYPDQLIISKEVNYKNIDKATVKELVEEINYLRKRSLLLEDTIFNLKTYSQSLTEGILMEKNNSRELQKKVEQLEKELEEYKAYESQLNQ